MTKLVIHTNYFNNIAIKIINIIIFASIKLIYK